MEKQALIDLLNRDIADEHAAIGQALKKALEDVRAGRECHLKLREDREVKKHSGLVINLDLTVQQEAYQAAEVRDWPKGGTMKRFEYEITKHPADTFNQVVYFCSEVGECSVNEVPGDQTEVLADTLNERGKRGWELVQISFGKDGAMAFWKRKVKEKEK